MILHSAIEANIHIFELYVTVFVEEYIFFLIIRNVRTIYITRYKEKN